MYYPKKPLYENAGVIFKVVDPVYQPEKGLLFFLILNTTINYTHINVEVEDDNGSHYFQNIMIGGSTNDYKNNQDDAVYLQLPTPGAKITESKSNKFTFTIGKDVNISFELYNENLYLYKSNYRSSLGIKGTFSFKFLASNEKSASKPKNSIKFNDPETNNWWKELLSSSDEIDLDDNEISNNGLEILSNICSKLPINPPTKKRNFNDNDDDDDDTVDDDQGPPPLRRIEETPKTIQNPSKKVRNQAPEVAPEATPVQNPNLIQIVGDLAQLMEQSDQDMVQPAPVVQPVVQQMEHPVSESSVDEMWKQIERSVENNDRDNLDEMWKQIEERIQTN